MKPVKDKLLKLYRNLVCARQLDELMIRGLQDGKVMSFFHSGQGEEAVPVGACTFLNKDDIIYIPHRGHGQAHIVAKGGSVKGFVAEHYGKATGACKGISAVHFIEPESGILGYSMTMGSAFTVPLGWALAAKKNNRQQVVVSFFGDGTSNRGTLHEAMNLASLWKLPVVWVCSNNQYAQFMPIKDAYVKKDIAGLAAGYDMPGVVVDGMDVLAVWEAVDTAVKLAKAGKGPSFIECKTFRYRPHSEGILDSSHETFRSQDEIEEWKKRDPIKTFEKKLLEKYGVKEAELEIIRHEVEAEIEEADRFAMDSPLPDLSVLDEILYAG